MISKIFKYSNFDAVVKYVFNNLGATLDHTNMTSRSSAMLAREFQLFAAFNPQEKCTCYHIILSIVHRSADNPLGACNQHLSEYDYNRIARRYLEQMGFLSEKGMHRSQYLVARVRNIDEEEIHIIVSRIRMDGTIVSNYLEKQRNEFVIQQLNYEFDMEDMEELELVAL